MLYTPAALELALRCPFTGPLSSGGDDDKPEMAESILVRSEGAASTDMLVDIVRHGLDAFLCGQELIEVLQKLALFDG